MDKQSAIKLTEEVRTLIHRTDLTEQDLGKLHAQLSLLIRELHKERDAA